MTQRHVRRAGGIATVMIATLFTGGIAGAARPGAGVRATQDDVYEIGDGVSAPQVTHQVKANYTPAAMDAKIQGTVVMRAVVRRDGTVGTVVVTQSLDSSLGLDEAAVTALRQWTFEPGQRDGAAVPVRVSVEMRFTLKD